MQRWEYLRVIVNADSQGRTMDVMVNDKEIFKRYGETQNSEFSLFDYFTELGKEGWEMVNALPWWGRDVVFYIFKRPIEE